MDLLRGEESFQDEACDDDDDDGRCVAGEEINKQINKLETRLEPRKNS